MLIVPIGEAREGMKLAVPVSHPENAAQVLLRQGYALDHAVIARMRSIGISFIYVEYPALDSLDRHLAVQLSPERQAIYKDIKQSITQVQRQTHVRIPYDNYCKTTRDMVSVLMTQGQNPIYLDQMSRQGSDVVGHAAAVAHLSLLLGLKLEAYLINQRSRLPAHRAKDVVNLGVAGMLHDLGMGKLPESLQGFCETDPPKDSAQLEEWQSHARIAYDLIHNDVESTAAAAVYQHHQHFDGSGFPTLKLAGGTDSAMDSERIHVFARIILCANLFDRLASPPNSKVRRTNYQVLQIIEKRYAGWYDPEVFRVLQAVTPPFPPGCRVKLSDGTLAIVTDINPGTPLQPIVRRLAGDNWELVGDPVDLSIPDAPQIQVPSSGESESATT